MNSQTLRDVRRYEETEEKNIEEVSRPAFHLSARVGWMNDPNGFSFYGGLYHLFYQYNPYDSHWGPMHWGHAVSKDLISWEYMPAVLAPDTPCDGDGCFSGSAIELPDGKHLLVYTGVRRIRNEKNETKDMQVQAIAIGDGVDYEKYEQNPVISSDQIPEGLSPFDFRDPKIWKDEKGSYRLVVGGRDNEGLGHILMYESPDCKKWDFVSTIIKNDGTYGTMWECPDFFNLDGWDILLTSPMEMLPKGLEFHNGGGTLCVLGTMNKDTNELMPQAYQCIDYGIDFYAPQTNITPDGRRIMVAWMQNWDTVDSPMVSKPWFGQMTIPRELSVKDGRLYQNPIREFEGFRTEQIIKKDVHICGETFLEGISGRLVDLTVNIRPGSEKMYHKFSLLFAKNDEFHTSASFRPYESTVKINRKFSGSRRTITHQRRCRIEDGNTGCLKIRLILDRYSAELFINDGRYVMTTTIYTPVEADKIAFFADGEVVVDVEKYTIKTR